MANSTNGNQSEIGMIGLGVMGRNLLLNMADHGFTVAGYDKDLAKVAALATEAKQHSIYSTADIKEFINSLRQPRAIMFLVPAGAPVDAVIKDLLPLLQTGDLIIDAGNSFYRDTEQRVRDLAAKGIKFFGIGVSGGEEGARHGPSIMPGGDAETYARVKPIFEAVAAKVNNEACVRYIGPGASGHYVKMVHNGIEYGIMQLIAETYALMKTGLNLDNAQLAEIYTSWNQSELNGYLMEITGHIFRKQDPKTGKLLLDVIKSVAQQKGTGMWTSRSAMELQVATPIIDVAVCMRDLTMYIDQREQANKIYPRQAPNNKINTEAVITQIKHALYASVIMTYAQGMALLAAASKNYEYHLDLEGIAKIWRGGCIIRSALLEDICTAFKRKQDLPNLLLDANIAKLLNSNQQDLRKTVALAAELGVAAPCIMAALSYFDSYRNIGLPANLIQAQRDYFGAHTYERIDGQGVFHTEWTK